MLGWGIEGMGRDGETRVLFTLNRSLLPLNPFTLKFASPLIALWVCRKDTKPSKKFSLFCWKSLECICTNLLAFRLPEGNLTTAKRGIFLYLENHQRKLYSWGFLFSVCVLVSRQFCMCRLCNKLQFICSRCESLPAVLRLDRKVLPGTLTYLFFYYRVILGRPPGACSPCSLLKSWWTFNRCGHLAGSTRYLLWKKFCFVIVHCSKREV